VPARAHHLLMLRKNSGYFACGGGPALCYAGLAGLREMARHFARWVISREPRALECGRAVVRGWIDFARNHFGAP
jgi:hypothetical protein